MVNTKVFGSVAVFLALVLAGESVAQSSRPGVGSFPYADQNGTGVTFRVWAPNASSVGVKGQFNGWGTTALTKEGATGYWSGDIASARAGQEYLYRINNSFDKRDPRARRVTNSNGNSIIYDPKAFNWGGVNPVMPWFNDLVIYEMHVGTYNAEAWVPNTFDQAISKLDHLVNLGVSAVEVMPIAEFAGDKSWGYNPADPYAVESALGGPDAFKRFVKACHERGIAVFVDVVHNHYGPSDLSLWQFDGWGSAGGIYFYNDSRGSTMWGDTRPDFGRPEVREFISDNIRMFLEEYRVDGFRWDSVWSILYANNGSTRLPEGEQMLRDINWMVKTGFPGRISIAEDNAYDFNVNFDSQWDVGFGEHIKWQVTRGSDSERNMQWLGDQIGNWNSLNRVLYSESHDSVGGMNGKQRLPRDIDGSNPQSIYARKRQLLAAGVVMTSPGIPMIFQGQEMNEDYAFAAETAIHWGLTNSNKGIVRSYSDLIHLRRNVWGGTQGLKGTGVNVHHKDDSAKVISYIRWDAGGGVDDVVVVANFSGQTRNNYQVQFPSPGVWHQFYNGDATNYASDFGNVGVVQTVTASGNPPKATLNLGMYSMQIYAKDSPLSAGQVTLDPAEPDGCVDVAITYAAGAGPLASATQVVAAVGLNNWQSSTDFSMTKTGEQWVISYSIPLGTHTLDIAFHNGATNRVWDNNKGLDWHYPVENCADIPAVVTASPEDPIGCVPVTITYEEWAGPLQDSSNLVLFVGRNGWQDVQSIPMNESPPGVWSYELQMLEDTWQLDFVFNNGGSDTNLVWDNNNGQDWHVYVLDCVDSFVPFVTITNPPSDITVSDDVANYNVSGVLGGGVSGRLMWTNAATGEGGLVTPLSTNWALPTISLAEGINLIRVSGTNDTANPNAASRDAATNSVYTAGPSWEAEQNGGVGWGGGWQMEKNGSAGFFLATSNSGVSNLRISRQAWGLWANNGGFAGAARPLAGPLNVGDVLQVKLQNNNIGGGGSTGIALQNRYGQSLFEFYFAGGGTNYLINDTADSRPTGKSWTRSGFTVEFELTSPTEYTLRVSPSLVVTGELASASEVVINRVRFWNYNAGAGEDGNFYVADLRIDGPAQLESHVYQSEVAITRRAGPFSDSDGDGFLNWEEEFAGTDPHDASSHLPYIGVIQPGAAGWFEIPRSSEGKWYDLFVNTNLVDGVWTRFGVPRQGTGGSIWLDYTNDAEIVFYRTGVFEPNP